MPRITPTRTRWEQAWEGWVAACVGCVGETGSGLCQEEIIFQRAVSPLQGNSVLLTSELTYRVDFLEKPKFKMNHKIAAITYKKNNLGTERILSFNKFQP